MKTKDGNMRALLAVVLAFLLGGWALAQTTPLAPPPPAPALTPENTLYLDLSTGGKVAIQLRPDVAPRHVERIKTLVRRGFYDGLTFHRVIEGFMAQGGDPKGTGEGGSDLPDLPAEFNGLPHVRGAVAMARAADPNSANSQFYIMFAPRMALDGRYTVFGRVVGGMQYVDAIKRGEGENGEVGPEPSRIVKATIAGDVGAGAVAAPAAAPARAPAPVGGASVTPSSKPAAKPASAKAPAPPQKKVRQR